jgi:hypothetical protein
VSVSVALTALHTAAQDLLGCVCDELNTLPVLVPGMDGCPCRACVVPGTAAADGCDESCGTPPPGEYPGQLTVNVARLFSSDRSSFPREVPVVLDGKNCAPPQVTAAELVVTVFRCVPLPTDEGCPPTCDQLSASAAQLHADMMAVRQAIVCCYVGTDEVTRYGRRFALGPSVTVGPQGGCVGLEQRVVVVLPDA